MSAVEKDVVEKNGVEKEAVEVEVEVEAVSKVQARKTALLKEQGLFVGREVARSAL